MVKLSRYILVLVTILVCSVILPELFRTAFDSPIKTPFIQYSCINDDFMILKAHEKIRTDTKGNTYTRGEFEEKLPLMYSRQLMIDQKMPDTILGVPFDMHTFAVRKSFTRIKPTDLNMPHPKLYPLFEAESGRANLELPEDVFRINWRIDFINANTNQIDEDKSRMFSAALYHKGFKFPAKLIAGIPTTRKSCDEGYFIIDSEEQLFHLKMIMGEPYVKNIDLPEGVIFKHITCVDHKDKRFFAYLISDENKLYSLAQEGYRLISWPIEGFDADLHQLRIYGDYFNYQVYILADSYLIANALDRQFNVVNQYTSHWTPAQEKTVGKVSAAIFPFKLNLSDKNSRFINFYPTAPIGIWWVLVNLVFVVGQIFIVRKRGTSFKNQILDLVLVAVSGVFGFIAVNVFPNKFQL